jgi:type IV secretory pathway VirB2 component (pilin)
VNPDAAVPQTGALAAAINWIELTLVGNLATAIAIIAIGWFGMMMLSGRFSRRRGIQLIVGCFIIFGASTIASGVMSTLNSGSADAQTASPDFPVVAAAPAATPPSVAVPYDPYAGAALPPRR